MKKMKNSFLNRIPLQIAAFMGLFLLIECTKVIKRTFPDSHNSAHTLDWNGTYKSTVPDTTYSGTVTEITLDTARKYIIKKTYLEKGVQAVKGTEENGNFSWNKAGNTITLLGIKNQPNQYFIGENRLWELDKDGNNYAGKLIVNGNKIDFTGPLAVTKMACLDDKGNGENLFLETLKKVNNYSINPDSTLNFIMGDIAIMRFTKK